jgi:hypothetical protein
LTRDVPRDAVLTFDDVTLPANRLADSLYREQCERFTPDRSAGREDTAAVARTVQPTHPALAT